MSLNMGVSMSFLRSFGVLALTALTLAGCSKQKEEARSFAPVVAEMKQSVLAEAKQATAATATMPALAAKPAGAVVSEVTLNKASLLGRVFNYSASLQFSSIVDGDLATAMMGLSLGEVPAHFHIIDNKLLLLTDGSINFESDVNKPSRLIYEFPILAQTEETITIRAEQASPIMDTFLFGTKDRPDVRYSFIRSMEYAAPDELFMVESTVELKDGSIGEFLESFRPRERTVPSDAKAIYADEALNPKAARYGFIDAGEVYVNQSERVRVKTKAAARFLLENNEPIKWYVTANIPDTYLIDLKNGVEAWNRYSRAAGKGDLVRFEGRLPEGVKVGDPRYNLIIWDTVQKAGAAYESQNADPITGVQSHSMIYIPYAWINIGKDFWTKFDPESQGTEADHAARLTKILKARSFLGRALPVHCMDEAEMHLSLQAKESPEQFARGLLKGVVFHEMGHAMGLAHNFKGSLSYDSEDASKQFSTSVMDYNQYDVEDGAFGSIESADGPLLEYDRQIISVLYNEGKDVKDSDPELPTCNDTVADSVEGGVDPLCVRYDIGKDLTVEALRSLDLFSKPGLKRGKLESITPAKVTNALLALPAAAEVKSAEELKVAVMKGLAGISGTVSIYVTAGGGSFGYMGSQSMKALKVYSEGVLPETYKEAELRERALAALDAAVEMNALPALSKEAVNAAKAKLVEYISSTAFVSGLPLDAQKQTIQAYAAAIDQLLAAAEGEMLSKMRTRFIAALLSTPTAPLAFTTRDGKAVDVELVVIDHLEHLGAAKAGDNDRPLAERAAALTVLKTYARSENYQPVAERVTADLKQEIRSSTDAVKKEQARALLELFLKAPAEAAKEKK